MPNAKGTRKKKEYGSPSEQETVFPHPRHMIQAYRVRIGLLFHKSLQCRPDACAQAVLPTVSLCTQWIFCSNSSMSAAGENMCADGKKHWNSFPFQCLFEQVINTFFSLREPPRTSYGALRLGSHNAHACEARKAHPPLRRIS